MFFTMEKSEDEVEERVVLSSFFDCVIFFFIQFMMFNYRRDHDKYVRVYSHLFGN